MLYTEDFTMRHYVGFSQIGSQICTSNNILPNIIIHKVYISTYILCAPVNIYITLYHYRTRVFQWLLKF